MRFLIKLLLTALVVLGAGYLLPGVSVDDYVAALFAGIVIALLNAILKPILVVLTIPLTILTLGLFLLVINAALILLAAYLIDGFYVDGFWWALLFSIILSLAVSLIESLTGSKSKK